MGKKVTMVKLPLKKSFKNLTNLLKKCWDFLVNSIVSPQLWYLVTFCGYTFT